MTNSLAENIYALGETIAENLVSMGVSDADPDDGLTTLAGKILDIPPTVVGIELDTEITCAADKQSVNVGETVTFSGKLRCYYDDETASDVDLEGVLQGATIRVYNGNLLLGTAVTDSEGLYSYTYTVSTMGDLSVKAVFEGTEDYKDCYSSTVPVEVVSFTKLGLVSDKNIISAADGESAVLTCSLLDANDMVVPISGELVDFKVYKGDVLVETLTSQETVDGVCSVSYLGQGAGDISIQAECMNVSETYIIEDCYKFDSLTSDKNLFSVTSGSATINYSNDGVTITGNTSTETHIVADFTLPESDYEITYDVNAITTASDGYTLHSCFEDLLLGHNRNGFYARKVSVSGDIWSGGVSYNPPCTMKLEVSGTTTKTIAVYRNNSQIKTTLTGINKTGVMQFLSYANGRGLTLKNLKIKPL